MDNFREDLVKRIELIKANIYEMVGGESIEPITFDEFKNSFDKGFEVFTEDSVMCYIDDLTKSENSDGLIDDAKLELGSLKKVFVKGESGGIHPLYVRELPKVEDTEEEESTEE